MTTAEEPACISILVADHVYQDQAGKHIVAGTFDTIGHPGPAPVTERFSVFFTLTNARGTSDLSLCIEHEESGETILELQGPYKSTDPLFVMNIVVHFQNGVAFPRFGKYWVQVKSGPRILQQRPLFVVQPDREDTK
jgi:hypothetical protein